jgi:hypothetical protein
MKKPTYNHTRADGPFDPCPECAKLQSPAEKEARAADKKESFRPHSFIPATRTGLPASRLYCIQCDGHEGDAVHIAQEIQAETVKEKARRYDEAVRGIGKSRLGAEFREALNPSPSSEPTGPVTDAEAALDLRPDAPGSLEDLATVKAEYLRMHAEVARLTAVIADERRERIPNVMFVQSVLAILHKKSEQLGNEGNRSAQRHVDATISDIEKLPGWTGTEEMKP